jgi:hypothetical protein
VTSQGTVPLKADKSWDKMIANKNIKKIYICNSLCSRRRCSGNFWTDHQHYLFSNLWIQAVDLPTLIWVLCKEDNSTSNTDMLQNCTILKSGNTASIVKLYWEIEFLSSAWALNTTTIGSRFTTGLCSRIFGCKLNNCKTSTIYMV